MTLKRAEEKRKEKLVDYGIGGGWGVKMGEWSCWKSQYGALKFDAGMMVFERWDLDTQLVLGDRNVMADAGERSEKLRGNEEVVGIVSIWQSLRYISMTTWFWFRARRDLSELSIGDGGQIIRSMIRNQSNAIAIGDWLFHHVVVLFWILCVLLWD